MDIKKLMLLTEAFLRPQKISKEQINIDMLLAQYRKYEDYVWVFFDTETTGFHPKTAQIVQIAAEVISPEFLGKETPLREAVEGNSFHAVCSLTPINKAAWSLTPEQVEQYSKMDGATEDGFEYKDLAALKKEISGAFRVNKYDITYASDEGKVTEEEALNNFISFLNSFGGKGKVVVIAHNAPFDIRMISGRCAKYGIEYPNYDSIDTVQLAQKIWYPLLKLQQSNVLSKLTPGRGKYVKHSFTLDSISKAMNINADNMHNAVKDVENMIGASKEMLMQLAKAGSQEKEQIQQKLDRTKLGRRELIKRLNISNRAKAAIAKDLSSRPIGTETKFADKYRETQDEYDAEEAARKQKAASKTVATESYKKRNTDDLARYLDSIKHDVKAPPVAKTNTAEDEPANNFEKELRRQMKKEKLDENVLMEQVLFEYHALNELGDDTSTLEDGLQVCEACLYEFLTDKNNLVSEAKYHGRSVPLNKPMKGDVKKFKVYVRNPSTGNIKKVNFGDKKMRIKKSNPKRRKSFRARHHCENPGPKTKARYWSCKKW